MLWKYKTSNPLLKKIEPVTDIKVVSWLVWHVYNKYMYLSRPKLWAEYVLQTIDLGSADPRSRAGRT